MTNTATNSETGSSRNIIPLLGSLVLVAALVVLWQFAERFELLGSSDMQLSSPACDVRQGACTAHGKVNGEDVSIRLEALTDNIASLQTTDWQIQVTGITADNLVLDLQGVEMFMGPNQNTFSPVISQPGLFDGQATLGVCTTGEMLWRATVLVDTPQGKLTTWFDFEAH